MLTISQAIEQFLDSVSRSRSENTARSYRNAMRSFKAALEINNQACNTTEISLLSEDSVIWFATYLKRYTSATEQLYLTATVGLFEYLVAERLHDSNLPRVRLLIRQRSRKSGQRLPQFPRNNIEIIINYAINLASITTLEEKEFLRNLRDRAFILCLADTGLRVHEACKLKRGDMDWNEARALTIGKGNREAVIRFSNRSLTALRDYLNARSKLDGKSGKPLASLPIFARHDRGAGKKISAITTATGRNIIKQRVIEAIGHEASGTITPHSFRHYFVTTVLRGSGGNLKLAQELARHRNIAVTQRYAHLSDNELDKGYWEIFDKHTDNSSM